MIEVLADSTKTKNKELNQNHNKPDEHNFNVKNS